MTKTIFGSYEFVERCAKQHSSPLDMDYQDLRDFDEKQINGFKRCALAFVENYMIETRGHYYSAALLQTLDAFEKSLVSVQGLNNSENISGTVGYAHLRAAVGFIDDTMDLIDKYRDRPFGWRIVKDQTGNITDELAKLMVEIIVYAADVCSPAWTAWTVQHNIVWAGIFKHGNREAQRVIGYKVRRLIYDEIKQMDQFANFRGARLLGFCLNVLGLKLIDRHKHYRPEFYPLQVASIGWAKANYKGLVAEHPRVAEACLQGWISYDADNHRLVQTFSNWTGKERPREYLCLD